MRAYWPGDTPPRPVTPALPHTEPTGNGAPRMERTLAATGGAGLRGDRRRGCLAGRDRGQSRPAKAAALSFCTEGPHSGVYTQNQSHAGPLGPAAGRRRTRRGTRCPLSVTDSKSLKPTESQTYAAPAPISSMQATNSPLGVDWRKAAGRMPRGGLWEM